MPIHNGADVGTGKPRESSTDGSDGTDRTESKSKAKKGGREAQMKAMIATGDVDLSESGSPSKSLEREKRTLEPKRKSEDSDKTDLAMPETVDSSTDPEDPWAGMRKETSAGILAEVI